MRNTLPMDTTALNLGQLNHCRFQPGILPSVGTGLCKMSACKFWLNLRRTFCVTPCHIRDALKLCPCPRVRWWGYLAYPALYSSRSKIEKQWLQSITYIFCALMPLILPSLHSGNKDPKPHAYEPLSPFLPFKHHWPMDMLACWKGWVSYLAEPNLESLRAIWPEGISPESCVTTEHAAPCG